MIEQNAKSEISIVLLHLITHSCSSPSEVGTEDLRGRTPLKINSVTLPINQYPTRGTYRVTHLVGEHLLLTWVLKVPLSCLGSK